MAGSAPARLLFYEHPHRLRGCLSSKAGPDKIEGAFLDSNLTSRSGCSLLKNIIFSLDISPLCSAVSLISFL